MSLRYRHPASGSFSSPSVKKNGGFSASVLLSFLKFGASPGTLFIYFVFSLRDLHYYNIHPRDGLRLLGIFLSWV
jgi:hypothetical protein